MNAFTETGKRGVIHRQSLSIPFAIWGDDGGGVAVVTDPANVVLTGQEVLLLTDKTFKQERNARGQLRSQHFLLLFLAKGRVLITKLSAS